MFCLCDYAYGCLSKWYVFFVFLFRYVCFLCVRFSCVLSCVDVCEVVLYADICVCVFGACVCVSFVCVGCV